jgi:hypothetical protein
MYAGDSCIPAEIMTDRDEPGEAPMTQPRRLEPLTRGPKRRAGTWDDVQAPHPGVRGPRAVRVDDWPVEVNAAIISACVLVTAFALLAAWSASPVGEAENWTTWQAAGDALSVEHPEGWSVRRIDRGDQLHVVIMRSPWVRVHIVSESELASTARLYAQIGDGGARYRALETLHRKTRSTWSSFFGDLDEGRATRTAFGPHRAVWSQFTYTGTVLEEGEAMRGYRATVLGPGNGVIAGAVAPAQDWADFRPIALRIIRSIRIGKASR